MDEQNTEWAPPDPADRAIEDDTGFAWWWWLVFAALVVGLLIWALSGGDGDGDSGSVSDSTVQVAASTSASPPAVPDSALPSVTAEPPQTAAPVPPTTIPGAVPGPITAPIATQPPAQIPGVSIGGNDGVSLNGATSTAECVAKSSTDSRGNPVRFSAKNLLDGDRATAWRCPGSAVGEQVVVQFPTARNIARIGAVAGWDHRDRFNGDDRFKENRRLTAARWECITGDGSVRAKIRQDFADNRTMQTVKAVGFEQCAAVRLVVLDTSRAGRRDFLALSDISIG